MEVSYGESVPVLVGFESWLFCLFVCLFFVVCFAQESECLYT